MNKYPLERFKRLVNDADYVFSTIRLNELVIIRSDIDKQSLIDGLNQIEQNCFFYANFQKDEEGNKHLEVIRQG